MSQKITNGPNDFRKNLPYHSKGNFFVFCPKVQVFEYLAPKNHHFGGKPSQNDER